MVLARRPNGALGVTSLHVEPSSTDAHTSANSVPAADRPPASATSCRDGAQAQPNCVRALPHGTIETLRHDVPCWEPRSTAVARAPPPSTNASSSAPLAPLLDCGANRGRIGTPVRLPIVLHTSVVASSHGSDPALRRAWRPATWDAAALEATQLTTATAANTSAKNAAAAVTQ